ncbi:WYL domain-containing protein [Rhodobacter viridis]|uniref:WYL domain-containing protein n=1 Tax=Rhodobacter viridis TaxID=1054202 RepID=A0A318UGL5_9RHOB|nr:WYL domain-containing protein [Rhodobacter viridis]
MCLGSIRRNPAPARKRTGRIDPGTLDRLQLRPETAIEALDIAGCEAVAEGRLRVRYKSDEARARVLEPHGVLLGHRTYLVARDPAKGALIRTFRLDQILSAEVLDESFAMDPAFSMERFAARSYGV